MVRIPSSQSSARGSTVVAAVPRARETLRGCGPLCPHLECTVCRSPSIMLGALPRARTMLRRCRHSRLHSERAVCREEQHHTRCAASNQRSVAEMHALVPASQAHSPPLPAASFSLRRREADPRRGDAANYDRIPSTQSHAPSTSILAAPALDRPAQRGCSRVGLHPEDTILGSQHLRNRSNASCYILHRGDTATTPTLQAHRLLLSAPPPSSHDLIPYPTSSGSNH